MKIKRVLVIGLDGATWDVLMPLIKDGKLPTLEKLVENGSYGILESIIPPVTGGAWLSLATGKTPSKTGIIDFFNRKDKSYRLYPVSSRDLKGHAFWDYLSKAGIKVGIFNYPMLYPPYEINGFMVSGLGASPTDEITYPSSLKQELEQIVGKYEIYIPYHMKKYEDTDLFIEELNNFLDKFEKVIYYLIKNKKWDLLFLVFSVTDWIQHVMWKYIDENHSLYDPKVSPKYKQEFIKFWQRIDRIINNVLKLVGNDVLVFLVSDHGFGPCNQTFNLVKWLEEKGYLVRKKSLKREIKKLLFRSVINVGQLMGSLTKRLFLFKNTKRIIEKVDSAVRVSTIDEIDFEKSKAYCLGHTSPFGAIYINANMSNKEREKIKLKLIHDLRNIKGDIKKDVGVQIYEPKKIYSGEKSNFLPDIIFTISNWRCTINEDIMRFNRPLFEEESKISGSHRLNGIFLAYGCGIKKGYKLDRAKIYDIAPTILHIFGLPIPSDMDGRVLMEIFEPDSEFAKRKQKSVNPSYYAKEDKKLKKIIKNLKLKRRI